MEPFEFVLLSGLVVVVVYWGIDTWKELKPTFDICAEFVHSIFRIKYANLRSLMHNVSKHRHPESHLSSAYCFNANRIHTAEYIRTTRHR
jgi:hypothetical protein